MERFRKRDHKEIIILIDSLQDEFNSLKNDLNEIRKDLADLSLTEDEKEHHAFDNAQNLNISFFERMEKGQKINLTSGSYHYPSEDIVIDRFQYKHDHINKENKTEFGWKVHGFQKSLSFEGDEWTPCTFFANDKECQTSSCSGTIKKAI
jgi:hypothetical protein